MKNLSFCCTGNQTVISVILKIKMWWPRRFSYSRQNALATGKLELHTRNHISWLNITLDCFRNKAVSKPNDKYLLKTHPLIRTSWEYHAFRTSTAYPNVGSIQPEFKFKRVSTIEMLFGVSKTFCNSLLSELLQVALSEVVFSVTEIFYGM